MDSFVIQENVIGLTPRWKITQSIREVSASLKPSYLLGHEASLKTIKGSFKCLEKERILALATCPTALTSQFVNFAACAAVQNTDDRMPSEFAVIRRFSRSLGSKVTSL